MQRLILYGMLFFVLAQCRDKYNSPVHAAPAGYLVVEGYISNDTGATIIRLTRSVQLDSVRTKAETGATVIVEGKASGPVLTLAETGSGNYSGHLVAVNFSDQYRVHISASGREYVSDYSSPRTTPPIDSLHWAADSAGVKIYVSTHDPAVKTINYHWEYDETWEHDAAFGSMLYFEDSFLHDRDPGHQIFTCYSTAASTNVLIATSAGLSRDEISLFKIADISFRSTNRMVKKYSINVKQHGMSTDALNYYQLLAKNTEQLGSVFDAQPSALTGNLHSLSDANEPVIGFVECSAKSEKRIYISRDELGGVDVFPGYVDCGTKYIAQDTIPHLMVDSLFGHGVNIPISGTYTTKQVFDLVYASVLCVDCRSQGGTLNKPSFWP